MLEKQDFYFRRMSADIAAQCTAVEEIFDSELFRNLTRRYEYEESSAKAFMEIGWPLSPSIPLDIRSKVISLVDLGKSRFASNVLVGYFRRDNFLHLGEMIRRWESHPLFSLRMKIIQDSYVAHCDRKFTLSVPALLPLIEGILTYYVQENGLAAKIGKVDKIYKAAVGELDNQSLATWAIAQAMLHQFKTSTYAFTDLDAEYLKSINNRKITRHTIAHGAITKYDTHSQSLKLFLLLDAVHALKHPVEDEDINTTESK